MKLSDGYTYRYNWGEIDRRWSMPKLELCGHERTTLIIGMVFCTFYIYVPQILEHDGFGNSPQYGFYFMDDSIWLWFGRKNLVLYYPWTWKWYKRWELAEAWRGCVWIEIPQRYEYGKIATKHTNDYTYTLKNGVIQKRKATYYVDKTEWRWHWLKLLPWPRDVQRCINVSFNDKVGESSGSWKGGTTGCSYEMKKGELPLDTLRRMERERIFK